MHLYQIHVCTQVACLSSSSLACLYCFYESRQHQSFPCLSISDKALHTDSQQSSLADLDPLPDKLVCVCGGGGEGHRLLDTKKSCDIHLCSRRFLEHASRGYGGSLHIHSFTFLHQVRTHSGLTGDTVILPETTIPIDRSNCTSLVLPTPTVTPTTAPPTQPTTSTCQSLTRIAATSSACHTSSTCNSLLCNGIVGTTNFTILPCHTPPAVAVRVVQSGGNVLLDDVLTRSRMENVTLGGTTVLRLNITVQHENDAIILKVCSCSN